ncbi:GWxTD domain-containing protein [Rubrivirga sp.]|uniref:GWxTD domain-containing protein n=1 Tax=Rubrivirga sp. TaxID=1885344 RepID=UPI003B51E5F8
MRGALSAGLVLLAVAGCVGSGPPPPRLDAASVAYRAGEPVFVLDAVATVRDDSTGIDVALGVPPASVIFRPSGDGLAAVASWVVTVEQEGGAARSRSARDTLRVADAAAARDAVPVWRVERFEVPPGRYVVRGVVEDEASDRTAERSAVVVVPSPSAAATLGGLRFEGADAAGAVGPVDAASVPAGLDSLRAVVQAVDVPDGAVTAFAVVRLDADDAPAVRADDFTPTELGLIGRGVDVGSVDTVQVVRQTVLDPSPALDVVAPLPALGPGVYRAEVRLVGPDGRALDRAERTFVVRRRDYPLVTRLGDLLGPLVYLASPGELDALEAAETTRERRRAFDRFWGDRLDDRRLAAATVRAYYERVEEANRLFATYKDGWKTDRGMLYVLLGPPRFVEATPTGERWSYALGGAAPSVFEFERTAGRAGDRAPFTVLTLQRSRIYSDLVRQAQRQWRSGVVP